MNGHAFTLAGAGLVARPAGTLWWPEAGLLAVADLHLGKAGRLARAGAALLPPYETQDTLARLAAEIAATGARTVVCLGDSFDDTQAAGEMTEAASGWLLRLVAGRRWIWVAGNHDPAPNGLPGSQRGELREGPLTFRHEAQAGAAPGEVSGHFHPKLRVGGQSRRCFLVDSRRVILPAFGTYTGGLRAGSAALAALMGPGARALLTGTRVIEAPYPGRAA